MPVFTSSLEVTADYPTIKPSLNLNFAKARALDPLIKFTRDSGGTYVSRDGQIKSAGINEPRFDHDPVTLESLGLLIEESRTNIVYGDPGASNVVVTSGQANSLTDSNDAYKLAKNSPTTSQSHGGWSIDGTVSQTSYVMSIFVKKINHSKFFIQTVSASASDNLYVYYDIDTGVTSSTDFGTPGNLTVSPVIQTHRDGWYRLVVVIEGSSSTNLIGGFRFGFGQASNGAQQYQNTDHEVLVYGAQIENGSFVTSYIPSAGSTSAVTRGADNAEIKYDGWYDDSSSIKPSTFVGKFQVYNLGATRMVAEGSDGSTLKDFSMNTLAGAGNFQFVHRYTANNSYDSTEGSNITINTPVTFAFSYNGTGGDITGSANGSTPNVGTDDLGTTSQAGGDRMRIGSRGNNSLYLNGTISELRYYKFKASSDQLLLLQ